MPSIEELKEELPRLKGKAKVDQLNKIAELFSFSHEQDDVVKYAYKALELAEKTHYVRGTIQAYDLICRFFESRLEKEQAIETCEKGLAIAQAANYRRGEVNMLIQKARMISNYRGERKDGLALLEKALTYCQQDGYLQEEGKIYGNKSAIYLMEGDLEHALQCCELAIERFIELNDKKNLSRCFKMIGHVYMAKSEYAKTLEYYHRVLQIELSFGNQLEATNSHEKIGNVYFRQGNYPKALEHYFEALRFAEKSNLEGYIASGLCNIGNIYGEQGLHDKALKYYRKAMKLFKKVGLEDGYITTMVNVGETYLESKNYKKAQKTLEEALTYAQKLDNEHLLALNLYGIAGSYKGQNETIKALEHYMQAAEIFQRIGDRFHEVAIFVEVALINLEKEQYIRAIDYGTLAFDIAQDLGSINSLQKAADVLYKTYKAKGNFEQALHYYEQYAKFKDQLFNSEKTKEIGRLEWGYEVERKEREIELLEKDKIIQQQKITELEQSQQITQMNVIIEAQEKERKRIASELHDGLGIMLSSLKIKFSAIDVDSLTKVQSRHYQESMRMLDDCCRDVRNISHNLMPKSIIDYDFGTALDVYLADIDRLHDFRVHLHVEDLPENLSEKLKVNIFRIIQECMHNTIKYAEATEVNVQLIQHDKDLVVIFEDNGKGFVLEEAQQKEGIGLKNLASRVSFLKGAYQIDTAPNRGTCITMEIPSDDASNIITMKKQAV